MPKIREMKEEELKKVVALLLDEVYDDLPKFLLKLIKRVLRESGKPPYKWFVALDDHNEILGVIAWLIEDIFASPEEIILEISWIAVDEDSQRRGTGRELIQESLTEIKQSLPDVKITITVAADDEDAMKFYRSVLNTFFESKEPRGIRFWANV